ncbi:hypothetical protein FOMPIDRAFT_1113111 [Fomitopsis schrenkii]|uniref:Protein kinase domain-containing protein n=1 Tax=Fomitopsis schrenkii TaxID=2126942 RepID=S8EN14_FOMSC|nr:hypothetical protein FOMPIDRAFT_1113111 [Fomitopsis schrenkii]
MSEPVQPVSPDDTRGLIAEDNERYGKLDNHEIFWRNRQQWLQEQGYVLRPRYRTDWKPSWLGTDKSYWDCEDGQSFALGTVLDATRESDGLRVILKTVDISLHPYEVEIGQYLMSEERAQDPRNHCVRILDVLQDPLDPEKKIIVMPLLKLFNRPEFTTVGEVVAFLKQAIEGLHFMHDNHVAHRDISLLNVMMDAVPMYSKKLWHPQDTSSNRGFTGQAKFYTRTEFPVKYFYIDFGLSRKYNPNNGPPRELPIMGGDRSVPEFQGEGYDAPADPFRTDIYYLGNTVQQAFLGRYHGLEFIEPLVADMVQTEPEKRPTIAEVESRFDELCHKLSWRQLRGRLVDKKEDAFSRAVLGIIHALQTAKCIVKRCAPVPMPRS